MCSLIVRFVGPTWGPSGAHRTQVGPMLVPSTLLSGLTYRLAWCVRYSCCVYICMCVIFRLLKLFLIHKYGKGFPNSLNWIFFVPEGWCHRYVFYCHVFLSAGARKTHDKYVHTAYEYHTGSFRTINAAVHRPEGTEFLLCVIWLSSCHTSHT